MHTYNWNEHLLERSRERVAEDRMLRSEERREWIGGIALDLFGAAALIGGALVLRACISDWAQHLIGAAR